MGRILAPEALVFMKVLAIDAGNSRIKWGVFQDGTWIERGALDTAAAAELGEALRKVQMPDRIAIANVAGERVQEHVKTALERFSPHAQWIAGALQQCGVRSSYANPAQLGPDRWAALVAARERYAAACVVVMVGTTVTVDALSSEGVFLGGCILPGVALMQDALAHSTAHLARRNGEFHFFPDNTADAIMSGALNAIGGAIERIVRYLQEAGEPEPLIVLSGGAASVLAPQLHGRIERVDTLVLEGLVRIAIDGEQA
jgi:type III pantothenate kinase